MRCRRIAGLLAIAAVGAAVSTAFASQVNRDLSHRPISAHVRATIRTRPLVTSAPGLPAADHHVLVGASVHAFRIGMEIAAALAALGGVIALIGIENRPGNPDTLPAPWQTQRHSSR